MRQLYEHQKQALEYLKKMESGALFMEMRLGKTLVVVRWVKWLRSKAKRPFQTLVIAPGAVLLAWEKELKREKERNIIWLTQRVRQDRLAVLSTTGGYDDRQPGWWLINKEGHLAIPEIAYENWDLVVLDESTFIKNPSSRVSRFCCLHFGSVPHRCILTGMPDPKGPLDLFQQFKFLFGEMMGTDNFWKYRARHFEPGNYIGDTWEPRLESEDFIKEWVAKHAFICRRDDVGLGERRIYEQRYFKLPPRIRASYDEAEEEFVLALDGKQLDETQWLLKRHTWMRRMCCGWIEKMLVWRGKQDEVVELLQGELSDQQLVIWFNFKRERRALHRALRAAGISSTKLIGGMTRERRQRSMERFDKGKAQVMLAQLSRESGSFGVDLSIASTAMYFSPPMGRELRRQSEDRILSTAKSQKNEPLLFIDLLVEDSVDEDMYDAMHYKEAKGSAFLDAVRRMQERWHSK